MRLIAFAAPMIALAVLPAPAPAQWMNPALTETPITSREIARSCGDIAPTETERTLAWLDRICRSKERISIERCEAAWKAKMHE